MAMLWQHGRENRWNLEPSEERVVICAYEQVRGNIPRERTMREFEHNFYNGHPLKQTDLDDLNSERKRLDLPLIKIEETFHTGYTTRRGIEATDRAGLAKNREDYRAKYQDADPAARQRMFQVALAEQAAQGPPQMTFAEFQERKRAAESNNLTYNEIMRRQTASANVNGGTNGTKPDVEPAKVSVNGGTNGTKLDVERAKTMLAMTNNVAIRDQIIAKLDPPSRIQLLGEFLPSIGDAEQRTRYIEGLSGEQAYELASDLKGKHPVLVDELLMHALEHF